MALCEDGAVVGSVSGGCIEDDLIYRHTTAYAQPDPPHAQPRFPSGPPAFIKYGVSADEAHRFGLPCGGTLELLLEYDPEPAALRQLVRALEAGQLMLRSVQLADGRVTLRLSDTELVNAFGPEYRMLLIGAGQFTEYLATMALFNGFAVTVCDPREEYRGAWSVAGATVVADMPDDTVLAFKPDRRNCVVALTHDPKLDDLALLQALATDAFYVGAIGSRRNNEARRQRMIEHFGTDRRGTRALAWSDRHLHRQQDAAGDRRQRHGGDPGCQERRGVAARDGSGPRQGRTRHSRKPGR